MEQSRPPHLGQLLEDWVTIWHSELAAMATDPEVQQGLQRLIDAGAAQALLLARAAGAAVDRAAPPAPPGTAAPPGTPSPGPADERDTLAGLRHRVDELEQRLARLERD